MDDLEQLVAAVTVNVQYPNARWAVMDALASLSDREHQERVWIQHQVPQGNYFDNFDQAVHTLYDDWEVLPDPTRAIGDIVVDGVEIARLITLGNTLDHLIDELGDSPDADYLAHEEWHIVVSQAGLALSAMVLAGMIITK